MKKPEPVVALVQLGDTPKVRAAASSAQFPLPGWPLFRLGFRPFYLGAAAFALIAVPYWMAGLLGVVALPSTMPPLLWLRISAIVDACFRLTVDGVSSPSWTRGGCAQAR